MSEETMETGAETQTVTAETQGDQTTETEATGAETQSQSAETDGAEDATRQEATEEVETEGKTNRGKHQTTLEERALQLAEKRFAEMQAKFEENMQQKIQAETKPFISVDMEKLNAHFGNLKDAITDAELRGDMVTALELEDQLRDLRASLKDNEKKRTEWESRQTAQKKQQEQEQQKIQRIDESAEFYRAQKGIPQAAWDAAGQWLSVQFQSNPILGRQFVELIEKQGEMAAFQWADEYCQKNMGAKAKADRDAKQAGKASMVSGTPANGAGAIATFAELLKRPGPEIVKFQKENPAEFQKLKEAHFK